MSDPQHVGSGKVRELFEVGHDQLLLVASDRISAYDVVLPQAIPDKGKVLTGLTHHWLGFTESICPNHMISIKASDMPDVGMEDLAGRSMLCKRAEPIAIEFVVRGYLSGSGWKEYQQTGEVCGHRLPGGLVESDRLPEPILTPATKAVTGHDENITFARMCETVGEETAVRLRELSLAIYRRGREIAARSGIIIADTKFEWGRLPSGELILIDEVLTPDSSRFWPADQWAPGRSQPSYDKQIVRDWLTSPASGWDRSSGEAPPPLPPEVVERTRARYIEAYELLTGRTF
ncbi:MAG: phosphoribosylaminoimidazolesuccinocarboxamide synthase [Actinomycetota bacterium]